MDYKLAALKLLCAQLKDAKQASATASPTSQTTASPSSQTTAFSLGGILFQRAWLQGVLVSSSATENSRCLLDDGSGIAEIVLPADALNRDWQPGMYVMVVGHLLLREDDVLMIKGHKIVDLSSHPDREAMWYLEVIEAYKMFYQSLVDGLE